MKLFLLASIIASVLALPDSSANDGPSSDDSGAVLAGLLGCESVYYVTFDGPVCGVIAFGSKANGKVTVQTIRDGITGLDESIGPFPYHVHVDPVPSTGNCTGTGPHLDPYNITEAVKCDPRTPDKCQVGDLAGKHGNLTGPIAIFSYTDSFISLDQKNVGFIGGRAVVIHRNDLSRFVCANITQLDVGIQPLENPEDYIPVPLCKSKNVSTPGDPQPTSPPNAAPSTTVATATPSVTTSFSSTTVVTATVETTTSVTASSSSASPVAIFTSGARRDAMVNGRYFVVAAGILAFL